MGSRPSSDHRSSGHAYSRRQSGSSASDHSGDEGDERSHGNVDSSGLSEEHADTWTVDEVYAYLRTKKLSGDSLLCIRDNDIDGQTLLSLQEKDILEMGLSSVGMRKRLIKISSELNELILRRKKREQGAAVRAVAVAGKMKRMGATIGLQNATARIRGGERMKGAPVMASDLRASAALVLAGLIAEGRTDVNRLYHIDRGYEHLDDKLAGLGAQLERLKE